jgi:hypothetical protein
VPDLEAARIPPLELLKLGRVDDVYLSTIAVQQGDARLGLVGKQRQCDAHQGSDAATGGEQHEFAPSLPLRLETERARGPGERDGIALRGRTVGPPRKRSPCCFDGQPKAGAEAAE